MNRLTKRTVTICLTAIILTTTGGYADDTPKKKSRLKRQPNPAMAQIEDVSGLPRVLLIGVTQFRLVTRCQSAS